MPALLVLVLIFIILLIFVSCIRIVPQAQAMVVERLGAYLETWNAGASTVPATLAKTILISS